MDRWCRASRSRCPVSTRRARSCSSSPAPTRPRRSRRAFGESAGPLGARRARAPGAGDAHRRPRPGGRAGARSVSDGHFIGIDVGGTKIAVRRAPGRASFELLDPEPTDLDGAGRARRPARGGDRAPPRTGGARAVGIGLPSIIEFATGRDPPHVNLPLDDVPLRELLTERIGLPVYVENDASCAALAEAYEGGQMVAPHLVMFTDRDRRRRRARARREALPRRDGAAAELGHTIIGLDLDRRRARRPGRVPAARLARGARLRAARWTGSPPSPPRAAPEVVPRPAAGREAARSTATTRSRAPRGRRRTARARAADPRRAARHRHRQRDQHVRPATRS